MSSSEMQLAAYFLFILAISQAQGIFVKLNSGKVLGGQPDENTPKDTAAIFNQDTTHVCSGALINPSWILTSALCAKITGVYDMRVIIGKTFTNTSFDSAIKIKKYVVYPTFDESNLKDDIALVELENPADNDAKVLKVLSFDSDLTGVEAIVKGYGFYQTSNKDQYPGNITQRNTTLISTKECSNYPVVMTNKLCTKFIACNGDEGAPLILGDQLIAIVSRQHGRNVCGFEAIPLTLYTKVVPYRKWIETTANIKL